MTATAVQTKEYVKAQAENHLLVENKEFGNRKYVNFQMNRGSSKGKSPGGSKSWVHPPDALLRGHIVYNCKFLGNVEVEDSKGTNVIKDAIRKMKFYGHTEVEDPKGSAVVKDAITKLKFNKQIKRAEGQKPPKVELSVSVDGVTVQEPKYKVMQHRFPLHRISYCADDKSDKRIFTFIAKEQDSNKHHCFVFDSEKCAEEITLTIGQAFDLAYKKFLDSSRGDMNQKKQDLLLQKKVQTLTQENLQLKARVADLERVIDPKVLEELDKNRTNQNEQSPVSVGQRTKNPASPAQQAASPTNPFASPQGLSTRPDEAPVVGRRLENLILDDQPHSTPGRQSNGTTDVPALAPPPPIPARTFQGQGPTTPTSGQPRGQVDLFGAPPFNPPTVTSPTGASPAQPAAAPAPTSPSNPFAASSDPFGMPAFNPNTATPAEFDRQIQQVDKELLDLQTGFSQGLSVGDDFNLDDLDPLKQ